MKWKFGKSFQLFYFQVRESPSTYRLPPLHPTTFLGDTMNSKQRRSSELGGNEWAFENNGAPMGLQLGEIDKINDAPVCHLLMFVYGK